jgi:hypothetical protein
VELSGPLIVLDGDACAALAPCLVQAVKLYVARGAAPPRHLLDLADEVSRAARAAAEFRPSAQVTGRPGTGRFRSGPTSRACEQPEWLSVREAARVAKVSDSYVRRLARRRDVEASRGRSGAWLIDANSLTAWADSRNRKECKRKAV